MADASERRAEAFRDMGTLRLRSSREGDSHVIGLAGEFDLWGVESVERELQRVEATDARVIVLDLSELQFIDSSGVRVVVMADRRERGRLVVVRGSGGVHRVFEMCDMVRWLPFVDEHPDPARR